MTFALARSASVCAAVRMPIPYSATAPGTAMRASLAARKRSRSPGQRSTSVSMFGGVLFEGPGKGLRGVGGFGLHVRFLC